MSVYCSIPGFESLEILDVTENLSLTSIPHSILRTSKFRRLGYSGCVSLTSPPYALCKQGIEALQIYVTALREEKGDSKRVFPVVVIGMSMAGKTSLVLSLTEMKRILTLRLTESKLDEATRVFKVREVDLKNNVSVLFYDCGGQAIYHYAYQLTFRTESAVLLVINIAEFDRLAATQGVEAACQQTCVDWLSHLYIACPKLGNPVVALTHTEEITTELLVQRKAQLVETTEILRKRIIEHETLIADESSPFFKMKTFCDTSVPLLQPDKIHDFSSTSGNRELTNLRETLNEAGLSLLTDVPGSWYRMIEYFLSSSDPVISLSKLKEVFPEDHKHFILQYLHEIGKILWFRKHHALSQVVFHRIAVLTKMIELLFNHTADHAWCERIRNFTPYRHQQKVIELRKYKDLVDSFRQSGIMDIALLTNILERESELPANLAIEVLQLFHIICGPINEGQSYILPSFSTERIIVAEHVNQIDLMAKLFLNGLPVPVYAYSLISSLYIDMHLKPFNSVLSGMNGAKVDGDGTTKYILHDPEESSITLITKTPVSKLCDSWRSQVSALQKITKYVKSLWKAVRVEVVFYCSHCIMAGIGDPTSKVDPNWFNENSELCVAEDCGNTHYSGLETFPCLQGGQRCSVPLPFIYPCKQFSRLLLVNRCYSYPKTNSNATMVVESPVFSSSAVRRFKSQITLLRKNLTGSYFSIRLLAYSISCFF